MEGKLRIGARVALFGDNPKGKGEVIDGPDDLGNWKVLWDEKWDDESIVSWELLEPESVVS